MAGWAWTMVAPASSPDGAQFVRMRGDTVRDTVGWDGMAWDGMGWDCADC